MKKFYHSPFVVIDGACHEVRRCNCVTFNKNCSICM